MSTAAPDRRHGVDVDRLHLAGFERRAPADGAGSSPKDSGRAQLLQLAAAIAFVLIAGYLGGYGETVLAILFLAGCIVAHEFGHYIAARTGGVKVTEFFFGFGPKVWSMRRGETVYGVKAIPLGPYCPLIRCACRSDGRRSD